MEDPSAVTVKALAGGARSGLSSSCSEALRRSRVELVSAATIVGGVLSMAVALATFEARASWSAAETR